MYYIAIDGCFLDLDQLLVLFSHFCLIGLSPSVLAVFLTLFRMGGKGAKRPPTNVSPITSTNVGCSPQNFRTFSFNTLATLVENVKFVPWSKPKLLNLNQDHPSKKVVFLVKSL